MTRYEHAGGAKATSLASGISDAATSITGNDLTGWPTGATGPFWFTLNRGNSSEERCTATSRTGNVLSGVTRGLDGTSASSHSSGDSLEHTTSAVEFDKFDAFSEDPELKALQGLTSAANKVPRFTGSGTADLLDFLDEDTMVSDSATAVPSQQSVKAYVDSSAASTFADLTDTPADYVGHAGKSVLVKATEDGVEFGAASSGPTTVRKSADESVASSTTLQNDDELLFAIAANETRVFEAVIAIDAGDEAADIKATFAVPTGASGTWNLLALPSGTSNPHASTVYNSGGTTFGGWIPVGIDGTYKTWLLVRGICVNGATAGNVQFQWAQVTASATATTVLTHSHITHQAVT